MQYWLKQLDKQPWPVYTAITVFFVVLFVVPYSLGYYFLPLFILAALVGFFFILKEPQVGIYTIVIVTLLFERFFTWAPFWLGGQEIKIYLLDFFIGAIAFSILKSRHNYNFKKIMTHALSKSIAIFLIVAFFGFLRSIVSPDLDSGIALATLKNFFYAIFYFLTFIIFDSQEKILRLIKIILGCGIFLLPFVAYGYVAGHGLWSELTPGVRFVAAPHAAYLMFIFFIGLAAWLKKSTVLDFWQKRKSTSNLFIFILLIQLAGVAGGMFRHLWIGAGFALLAIFLLIDRPSRRKMLYFCGYGLLVLIVLVAVWSWFLSLKDIPPNLADNFYVSSFLSRTSTLLEFDAEQMESSFGWRLAVSAQGVRFFLNNPILGAGLGEKIRFSFRDWEQIIEVRFMHNDLVGTIMQLGILGLGALGSILFFSFRDLCRLADSQDNDFSAFGLGLLAVFVGQVFAIVWSLYFSSNMISLFFWLFLGLTAAMTNQNRSLNNEQHEGPRASVLVNGR